MTPNPIRLDASPANDNSVTARADESISDPLSRPRERVRERADLASGSARGLDPEAPIVSMPGDCSEHAYACAGNLILPLRFARRFPSWSSTSHDSATKG